MSENPNPNAANGGAPSKLDQLLRSRKFWVATIAVLTTVGLYALGELTADQFATSLTWVAAIYIGSVSVEDGLSRVFAVWLDTSLKLTEQAKPELRFRDD